MGGKVENILINDDYLTLIELEFDREKGVFLLIAGTGYPSQSSNAPPFHG